MNQFKVQRIRSCVQCGDVLALKCQVCIKHPDRKPRVVSIHDWPPILKTAECGCCIQIACQLTGCLNKMWRQTNRYGGAGKNVYARCFCSPVCASRAAAVTKTRGREVPCDWCRKTVFKKLYTIKSWKASYCDNTCYFLARKKRAYAERENRRLRQEDREEAAQRRALLHCVKCSDVTEHQVVGSKYETGLCLQCKTARSASTTPSVVFGDQGAAQVLASASR